MLISRPETSAGELFAKFPSSAAKGAEVLVEANDSAVVVFAGRCLGKLRPGRHQLTDASFPFVALVGPSDAFDIYFVSTQPQNIRFGSKASVRDPESGLIVEPRFYGEAAVRIEDPTKFLIASPAGTTVKDLVVYGIGSTLGEAVRKAGGGLIGAVANSTSLQEALVKDAGALLQENGIALEGFGSFTLALSEEDRAALLAMAQELAQARARAQAQAQAPAPVQAPVQAPAKPQAATVFCSQCGTAGAGKFCMRCGARLARP